MIKQWATWSFSCSYNLMELGQACNLEMLQVRQKHLKTLFPLLKEKGTPKILKTLITRLLQPNATKMQTTSKNN